jgi:hypothetical protein
MTDTHCSANNPDFAEVSVYRPKDIQRIFDIEQRTYYYRLNFLGIKACKDKDGKPYLDESQLSLFRELDEYIKINGKMSGFLPNNNEASLVKVDDSNLTASTNGKVTKVAEENIYVEPEQPVGNSEVAVLIREAEELKARELAMRDLIKRKLADEMSEDDLSPDLQEKVNLAREAANPKFTPQEVATTLLSQWRKNRLAS